MKTNEIFYTNLTKAQVVITTKDNKKKKITRYGSLFSNQGVYPAENRLKIVLDKPTILYTDDGMGIPLSEVKSISSIKISDYWLKRQLKLIDSAFFGLFKIHEAVTLEEGCKPPKEVLDDKKS